ncbi:MAG: PorV/PorQ family protein, partial [Gemmatimonadales bacterium]
MKNRITWQLQLILALVGAGASSLAAQQVVQPGTDNTGYGTTSAEFLLLGAGARGAALGQAYAAIASDVSALYYNPAGIAMMTRPGLEIGTYDYVASTRYSWGGVVFPFSGGSRSFGLQLGTFGFSNQPVFTEDQPNGTGSTYSVSETFLGGTFAQNFSDRFSAGITLKYIDDKLGTVNGKAFGVDFGTNFHAALNGHPVKFSFVLSNIGSNLTYSGTGLRGSVERTPLPGEDRTPTLPQQSTLDTKDFPLPTTFRVGLAYDILNQSSSRLTVLGDFNQPNSDKPGFVLGSEYGATRLGGSPFGFALRGSYS